MHNEILIDPENIITISTSSRTGTITIKNNSITGKLYKIKTTKPDNYTVKPSVGAINALHKATVKIIAETDCKITKDHKFLVEIYNHDTTQPTAQMKEQLKNQKTEPVFTKMLSVIIKEDSEWKIPKITGYKDAIQAGCVVLLSIAFVSLGVKMVVF